MSGTDNLPVQIIAMEDWLHVLNKIEYLDIKFFKFKTKAPTLRCLYCKEKNLEKLILRLNQEVKIKLKHAQKLEQTSFENIDLSAGEAFLFELTTFYEKDHEQILGKTFEEIKQFITGRACLDFSYTINNKTLTTNDFIKAENLFYFCFNNVHANSNWQNVCKLEEARVFACKVIEHSENTNINSRLALSFSLRSALNKIFVKFITKVEPEETQITNLAPPLPRAPIPLLISDQNIRSFIEFIKEQKVATKKYEACYSEYLTKKASLKKEKLLLGELKFAPEASVASIIKHLELLEIKCRPDLMRHIMLMCHEESILGIQEIYTASFILCDDFSLFSFIAEKNPNKARDYIGFSNVKLREMICAEDQHDAWRFYSQPFLIDRIEGKVFCDFCGLFGFNGLMRILSQINLLPYANVINEIGDIIITKWEQLKEKQTIDDSFIQIFTKIFQPTINLSKQLYKSSRIPIPSSELSKIYALSRMGIIEPSKWPQNTVNNQQSIKKRD